MTHGTKTPSRATGNRVTHPRPHREKHYDTPKPKPATPRQAHVAGPAWSINDKGKARATRLAASARVALVAALVLSFERAQVGADPAGMLAALAAMREAGMDALALRCEREM